MDDREPGIQRRRCGTGFAYYLPTGERVCEPGTLCRIRALAVPPAYADVWICCDAAGHLQATGRDARGRKQYRYHPHWRSVRDAHKYARMAAFGAALPRLRKRVERDLALAGLPRAKVVASVVRLLETTYMRVGNEEYVRANRSYGLTTLRDHHVQIVHDAVKIRFRGKHGLVHRAQVSDARLARIVRRCRDLPGQVLFQYLDDDGEQRAVSSGDVNEYLRETTGEAFTAKDFRTWFGSLAALERLIGRPAPASAAEGRRVVAEVVREVAEQLGNTPTICRKCYVHPVVVEAYVDGRLAPPRGRGVVERRLLSLLVVPDAPTRIAPAMGTVSTSDEEPTCR